MGPIYHALGVSVASIYPMQTPDEHTPARLYDPAYDSGKEKDPWAHFRPISRKEAYQADITYGTISRVRLRLSAGQHGDRTCPSASSAR